MREGAFERKMKERLAAEATANQAAALAKKALENERRVREAALREKRQHQLQELRHSARELAAILHGEGHKPDLRIKVGERTHAEEKRDGSVLLKQRNANSLYTTNSGP